MNINYNTSLKGEYTLYDENMNVLCETDNLITDWGMRRFVGDRSTGAPHPLDNDNSQLAFVNNINFIMLGTNNTPASATDFKLISAIPTSEYTFTNEGATTGTLLSTDPIDNDLLIIFTRLTRFLMASAFNPSLAPTGTYEINEVGCNWSQTVTADNRYGIFSRATLPSPVTIKPKEIVFVKYTLTVKTNANQVLENMTRVNGTGATAFPNNKTNVRDLPLFTLQTNGTPAATLNNSNTGTYGSFYCYHHPLFEDAGNYNQTYTGRGPSNDSTFGDSDERIWWLQFYTSNWNVATGAPINGGSDPLLRYNAFTSATTTNINSTARFDHNPCCACVSLGVAYNSTSGINYGGSVVYDTVISQNLDLFTDAVRDSGRKLPEIVLLERNNNIWTRKIKYLFTPTQLRNGITVLKLYRAPLGDWSGNAGNWTCGAGGMTSQRQSILFLDSVAVHSYGIVTVFNAPYTPNPSNFEGVEYTFTFTRT